MERYFRDTITFGLAVGPSERGVSHAVVMLDGEIAWDPHPSRTGLEHVDEVWAFNPFDNTRGSHLLRLDHADRRIAEARARPYPPRT